MIKYSRGDNMRYQIVEISWNKIYLNLKLNEKITDTRFQFFITTKKNKKKYPIKLINGEYFKINITSIADGDFLQNNEWYFKYSYNDSELLLLPFSIQSIDIAQLDKIYRYSGSAYAYIITFTLKEIDNHYTYCMNTTFMKKNTDISKRNYNIEYKRKKRRIKEYLFFLTEKFIEKIYHFIAKLHNKKGKNILLMSETRVPMNGNLKALYDKMMERELNKDYKIDLYFSKTNQKNYYKTLMKHVKIAIKAAKADYIFIDDFCSFFKYINPSKNTYQNTTSHTKDITSFCFSIIYPLIPKPTNRWTIPKIIQ